MKRRVCRAVESNVGERRSYAKKILRLYGSFGTYVLDEIFLCLDADNALMAQDASDNKRQRELLQALKNKTLKPDQKKELVAYIYQILTRNSKRWTDRLRANSLKAAEQFVKKAMVSTSNAQRAALKAAGVNLNLLKERWTVPVVRKQYVAPEAAKLMPDLVKQNVDLISKIGQADVERIGEVVIRGLDEGLDYDAIRRELKATQGFNAARADRVALDQINKINQQVQAANAMSIGCTQAIWKHVPGQYTSRRSHIKMDGKPFDINVGLPDPEVGYNVTPGMLPFCRCVARFIIPREIADD